MIDGAPHCPSIPATAPTACSQRTIELPEEAQGKLRQRNRWGTSEWITEYNRRTYIEGTAGVTDAPRNATKPRPR